MNSTQTSWKFHDALSSNPVAPCSIGATLIHKTTGEEIIIDILCDDPSAETVFNSIRKFYNYSWGIFETWEISAQNDFAPVFELKAS